MIRWAVRDSWSENSMLDRLCNELLANVLFLCLFISWPCCITFYVFIAMLRKKLVLYDLVLLRWTLGWSLSRFLGSSGLTWFHLFSSDLVWFILNQHYEEIWAVVLLASVLQNLSVKSPIGLTRLKSITWLSKMPSSDLMFHVISSDFSLSCLLSEGK